MPVIHLVMALRSEAQPVIEAYSLEAGATRNGFTLYSTDDMRLIVSGIGRCAAAAATGYLAGCGSQPAAWINLGMAGHGRHQVGDAILAHKVVDAVSGRCFFPLPPNKLDCSQDVVTTFETPQSTYPAGTACDMEAAGFMMVAERAATVELVQTLKVVSDTPAAPISHIDKNLATQLIADRIDILAALIDSLRERLAIIDKTQSMPAGYDTLLAGRHFTASQKLQLQRILQRWSARCPRTRPSEVIAPACKNAREVLQILTDHLRNAPIGIAEDNDLHDLR